MFRSGSLRGWRRVPTSKGQDKDGCQKQKTCLFEPLRFHLILLIANMKNLHSGSGRLIIQFIKIKRIIVVPVQCRVYIMQGRIAPFKLIVISFTL